MSKIDPVTYEIILHKLMQVAEEMQINYQRTSGSSLVVDSNDANVSVMLPNGDLVIVGPYMITQGNVIPFMVRAALERCKDNPGISEGDTFMCNDPYIGATHQADSGTFSPVFYEGKLRAWVGASGHQADIGGTDPGGFSMQAADVHQEGIRMPPTKLVEKDVLRHDIFSWILNSVRDPIVGLDIKAQLAANNVGRKRLVALFEKYGADLVTQVMEESLVKTRDEFAKRLEELPDGEWWGRQYIDHDGRSPKIYQVVCKMTKKGDRLSFDFSKSSPQANTFINCSYSGLVAGLLTPVYILLCPDMVWNQGILQQVEINAPEGTVCNCTYPAPCSMATLSGILMVALASFECVSKMLNWSEKRREETMGLWMAPTVAPLHGGVNQHGYSFSMAECSHFAGGGGARIYRDGVNTAGFVNTTTPNIPNIETTEQEYPILYFFRKHVTDSGGPGMYRGGATGETCYAVYGAPEGGIETGWASTGCEVPNVMGIAGGMPGSTVRLIRFPKGYFTRLLSERKMFPSSLEEMRAKGKVLPQKHKRTFFTNGSILYHCWEGGGGYGDPIEREPALVLQDVRDGLVSPKAANEIYGVVLNGDRSTFGRTETAKKRLDIRKRRVKTTFKPSAVLRSARDDLPNTLFLEDGQVKCPCGFTFGSGREGYKRRAKVEVASLNKAGRVRGELYGRGRFELRIYYCPRCARQLEVEVARKGDMVLDDRIVQ